MEAFHEYLGIWSPTSGKHDKISAFTSLICYEGIGVVTFLLHSRGTLAKVEDNALSLQLLGNEVPNLLIQTQMIGKVCQILHSTVIPLEKVADVPQRHPLEQRNVNTRFGS